MDVPAADVTSETTRTADIVFARLRLTGIDDFTLKSSDDGTLALSLPDDRASFDGVDRLLNASDVLTFHALRPDGQSLDRLVLETRRRLDDMIVTQQWQQGIGPAPVLFWLVGVTPLFGTPHLDRVVAQPDMTTATCRLLFEFSATAIERLAPRWDEIRRAPVIAMMGNMGHGVPLHFGPLEGRCSTTDAVDLSMATTLTSVLQAGCRLPRLQRQRP